MSDFSGIDYVNSFSHSGSPVKDLSRTASLLSELGDPQDDLRFIHIAGTNGKGSIAQMLNESCIDAGLKTGLFTSPFIFRYNDRIRINNADIPGDKLDRLALTIRDAVEKSDYKSSFSQFEITMAIGLLYFAEESCDIVILEAGLGGLLDCTNIIKEPLACVIGSVSYDHTQILGETLSEIATQKAGIIKKGCPCILSSGNEKEVNIVFRERCEKMGSELIIPDSGYEIISCDVTGSEFLYRGINYHTAMQGEHMVRNATAVIECMSRIGEKLGVTSENVKNAIARTQVPARVQVINREPLLILDGAHNPDGMKALAQTVRASGKKRCRAVIGMCRDKNMTAALMEITGCVDEFYTCDGFTDRAQEAGELAQIIKNLGARAQVCRMSALDTACELMETDPEALTLICGSLYLCSQVLSEISSKRYDFCVTI